MLVNLAGGSFQSYWGNILAGAPKVLIGVNLVQLAKPFDRDTHCKNSSVTCTPNLLHRHTKMEIGVSIEQIWCAGHTTVFTVHGRRR